MKKGNYVIDIISIFFTALLYSTTFLLPAFANEVQEQVLIVFDPDDESGYEDFYKITIDKGSIITKKPENPEKEGYVFTGWYAYLDENEKPVFWKFTSDKAEHNLTLWAAWKEDSSTFDTENEIVDGTETENDQGSEIREEAETENASEGKNDNGSETVNDNSDTEVETETDNEKGHKEIDMNDSKGNVDNENINEEYKDSYELDNMPKTGNTKFSIISSYVSAIAALMGLVILYAKRIIGSC